MTQHLSEIVEQLCNFQRKQRGKTLGGVKAYRWNLEQFLIFVRRTQGRPARVVDLTPSTIQAWMDDMASADLALSTMRVRQSTLSSLCQWLVKHDHLATNPEAAKARRRPRDVAIFSIPATRACDVNPWRHSVFVISIRRGACAAST
jgi:site-specific recombinase XerC